MVEVKIDDDAPFFPQCYFCWVKLDAPPVVPAVVLEYGLFSGSVCDRCLALSDSELRDAMRNKAAEMAHVVDDIRAAAGGPIVRPPADLVAAERAVRRVGGLAH